MKTKYPALLTPLLFFLFLFSFGLSWGQDTLEMKSGTIYQVKIIDINENEIQYRTYANPDGPLYRVSRSMVYRIKQEGGYWEVINIIPVGKKRRINTDETRRHYIGMGILDLIRTDFTLFYEYLLPGNKIGLRIPFTYGFRSAYFNTNPTLLAPIPFYRNTVFKTGLELRIYSGQGYGKVRYVFSPSVYYLRLNRVPSDYISSSPDFMVFRTENALRFMIFNGIQICPVEYIQFGLDLGFGADVDFGGSALYLTNIPLNPKAQLNLHLGYKF